MNQLYFTIFVPALHFDSYVQWIKNISAFSSDEIDASAIRYLGIIFIILKTVKANFLVEISFQIIGLAHQYHGIKVRV